MNITRQQQLLSLIKRIVSTELLELNHEALHGAVVTSVILSNDGRECRIWVDAPESTIHELNTTFRSDIQHGFMKKYERKPGRASECNLVIDDPSSVACTGCQGAVNNPKLGELEYKNIEISPFMLYLSRVPLTTDIRHPASKTLVCSALLAKFRTIN